MDSFEYDFAANNFWGSKLLWFLLGYGLVELGFAALVYFYWLPKLNAPRDPPIIRNYEDHTKRHKLFEKMLLRQERLCEALSIPIAPYFAQFIRNWFFVLEEDSENEASEETSLACIKETGLPCKEDIDKLISWGYFNVDSAQITEEWQKRELAIMYGMIKDRHGMSPGPKTRQKLQPVQMTIEPLDIKYRPLAVYIVFFICKTIMALFLRWNGFSHHFSSTGLPYWYRPGGKQNNNNNSSQPLPFLFFHGIAPAGATFYVPMIMWGLATDENGKVDRSIFLFENPAVAFGLTNHAPTEQETVDGVWEAVDQHCGPKTEVSTCGHSFGTCLQTYVVHSSQGHRVRQMVLMDPVSILLSDPDVITNFVYSKMRVSKLHDSVPVLGAAGYVMNELFIEHFLRRQFAWYNGELFLEDIPDHCQVIVCLSDRDEILNAQKIKAHIDIHNGNTPSVPRCMKYLKESTSPNSSPRVVKKAGSTVSSSTSTMSLESAANKVDLIYWEGEGVGHGYCLFDVSAWQLTRKRMSKGQQQIFKKKSL